MDAIPRRIDMNRKIAILSVSAGAGHVRAAEALRLAAEANFPGCEAVHFDVMDLVPKLFKKLYADSYLKIIEQNPALWGYLYEKTNRDEAPERSKFKRLRVAIQGMNTRKLRKTLNEFKPDYVICTHFLPAELLARDIEKGRDVPPCWVQVTDFDVHSLWIQKNMTGYFVACDEVRWRLVQRGIPAGKIHITGIPIMPAFGSPPPGESGLAELGADSGRPLVMLMSGGLGVGNIRELAEKLLEINDQDFQIAALAGKNQLLLESLNELAEKYPDRLYPLGFTNKVDMIMASSSLTVSKPGGLTTSECLAMGLPMIVVSPIPGQEERNADFLLENGAAFKAHDPAGVKYRVELLLKSPDMLKKMRGNALKLGKPHAATDVVKIVMSGEK